MASHAFITSWLMSPKKKKDALGVDWGAGTELASGKGTYGGDKGNCTVSISDCSSNGVVYSKTGDFGKGGSSEAGIDGPDVFIWFENKTTKQVIGGFLDRSRSNTTSRDFNNIKELWRMSPSLIVSQSGRVQLGLQGSNGAAKSDWFTLS